MQATVSEEALRRLEASVARDNAVRYLTEAQDVLVTVASAPLACDRRRARVDVEEEARRSRELLSRRALLVEADRAEMAGARPVLGVCLGMQGLVTSYGGEVARLAPAHGDVARIRHDGEGVFAGVPQDFDAVRYHSLGAVALPASLVATAWSEDGVVMGVRHRELPLEGVQFHPESVLSAYGADMVRSFLDG